jgi:hypothetical protein
MEERRQDEHEATGPPNRRDEASDDTERARILLYFHDRIPEIRSSEGIREFQEMAESVLPPSTEYQEILRMLDARRAELDDAGGAP